MQNTAQDEQHWQASVWHSNALSNDSCFKLSFKNYSASRIKCLLTPVTNHSLSAELLKEGLVWTIKSFQAWSFFGGLFDINLLVFSSSVTYFL